MFIKFEGTVGRNPGTRRLDKSHDLDLRSRLSEVKRSKSFLQSSTVQNCHRESRKKL